MTVSTDLTKGAMKPKLVLFFPSPGTAEIIIGLEFSDSTPKVPGDFLRVSAARPGSSCRDLGSLKESLETSISEL